MSEIMIVTPPIDAPAKRTPTVYFIDDSATMREVIKIAFRRENINVITCSDAASALAQFDQNPPDAVITDVIMPDQDGYSVCTQIKQHPQFGKVPVVLMSGVVNKTVADKAVLVQADELIRKPFQPQELIGRVKALLNPKPANAHASITDRVASPLGGPQVPSAANALNSLFAPAPPPPPAPINAAPPNTSERQVPEFAWPRALAEAFTPRPALPASPSPVNFSQPANLGPASQVNQTGHLSAPTTQPQVQAQPRTAVPPDAQRLRAEIARLDLLIRKLQTELQIERQYNQALEAQLQSLTRSE